MAVGGDGIEGKLARLRRAYLARLPDRVAKIEAAAGAVGGDPSSAAGRAGVEALRFLAHKLAGSGGTFGLAAVGAAAEDVERACETLLEAPSADARADLDRLIGALRDAADAAAEGGLTGNRAGPAGRCPRSRG